MAPVALPTSFVPSSKDAPKDEYGSQEENKAEVVGGDDSQAEVHRREMAAMQAKIREQEMVAMQARLKELEAQQSKPAASIQARRDESDDAWSGGIEDAVEESFEEDIEEERSSGSSKREEARRQRVTAITTKKESAEEIWKPGGGDSEPSSPGGVFEESIAEDAVIVTDPPQGVAKVANPQLSEVRGIAGGDTTAQNGGGGGDGVQNAALMAQMAQMMQVMMQSQQPQQQQAPAPSVYHTAPPPQNPQGTDNSTASAYDNATTQYLIERVASLEQQVLSLSTQSKLATSASIPANPAGSTGSRVQREEWPPAPPLPVPPPSLWGVENTGVTGFAMRGTEQMRSGDPTLDHGVKLIHSMFSHQIQLLQQSVRKSYHSQKTDRAKPYQYTTLAGTHSQMRKEEKKRPQMTMEMAMKLVKEQEAASGKENLRGYLSSPGRRPAWR